MANRVTIFHSNKFDLVSYGNGLSYALHDNSNKKSLFVQGDDATDFRNILDLYETKNPEMPYDDIMTELMHQLA